jgi:flagellar protein FlaG
MSANSVSSFSGVPPGASMAAESPASVTPSATKNSGVKAPAPTAAAVVDPEQTKKDLEVVLARLNAQMESTGRRLGFEYDPRTDRPVVSVFNRQTGELVRQIPNEVVLRVANSIEELKGVLFDERF